RILLRTAPVRLTLLYSGIFLLLGTTVIAVIVLLTGQSPLIAHVHIDGAGATVARAVPVPRLDAATQVGSDVIAQRSADFARLFTVSWAVLAVTTVGSAALGWVAAGRVLRPVRSITATAHTISAGNLPERLALEGPQDEFKALGDTLDELLARLQGAVGAPGRAGAHATH